MAAARWAAVRKMAEGRWATLTAAQEVVEGRVMKAAGIRKAGDVELGW